MAIYAVYNQDFTIFDVYTNKTTAFESMVANKETTLELRTYRHLTATQLKSLSYAEAISVEMTLRNASETNSKEQK